MQKQNESELHPNFIFGFTLFLTNKISNPSGMAWNSIASCGMAWHATSVVKYSVLFTTTAGRRERSSFRGDFSVTLSAEEDAHGGKGWGGKR